MSWGSLFQTEAAATTKPRSPIEVSRVAGMASKNDAAERRRFRPGTSATRRTSDDKYLTVAEHRFLEMYLELLRGGGGERWLQKLLCRRKQKQI